MLLPLGFLLSLKSVGAPHSEEDLVRRLKQGDHAAFRVLFDRHHANLYRFVLRSGASVAAAEDILQDVFTGVWTGRARLDPSRSIRAYLYRACKNRVANYFRGRSRMSLDTPAEPVSSAPSQAEDLHLALIMERLSRVVSELPERRRAVFELCFMSGLSYSEAAEILEISPKTVENQMGYAFKTIRESLAGFLDEA